MALEWWEHPDTEPGSQSTEHPEHPVHPAPSSELGIMLPTSPSKGKEHQKQSKSPASCQWHQTACSRRLSSRSFPLDCPCSGSNKPFSCAFAFLNS